MGIVRPLLAAAIVWVEWGALRAQAQTTEEADAFECSTEKFAGTYAFRRVVDGQGEPGVFSGSVGIMVIDAQGNATSLLTWTVTPDEIFSLDVADFLDIPSRLEANCTGSQQFVDRDSGEVVTEFALVMANDMRQGWLLQTGPGPLAERAMITLNRIDSRDERLEAKVDAMSLLLKKVASRLGITVDLSQAP